MGAGTSRENAAMKIQTVCDNRTFQRAYRRGRKHAGRYVVVYDLPAKGSFPDTRLGLTVTKGRGGAVVRNRIKRIIRAAFFDIAKRRPVEGGHDIIIVARDAARDIIPELELALSALSVLER